MLLTAKLEVDGKTMIKATAEVGSELGGFGGGHLNYFGYMKDKGKVVKYPHSVERGNGVHGQPQNNDQGPQGPYAQQAEAAWASHMGYLDQGKLRLSPVPGNELSVK